MLRNLFLISGLLASLHLHAESGADAWLRYAPLSDATANIARASRPPWFPTAVRRWLEAPSSN